MAVAFASVAMVSFAVDQTVTLSPGSAEGRIEFQPRSIGESLADFNPVRLIQSLIGSGGDRSEDPK